MTIEEQSIGKENWKWQVNLKIYGERIEGEALDWMQLA
jgi:hypothetical protein